MLRKFPLGDPRIVCEIAQQFEVNFFVDLRHLISSGERHWGEARYRPAVPLGSA
jgi:hypothetical protein